MRLTPSRPRPPPPRSEWGSFLRSLNLYSFRRRATPAAFCTYAHPLFCRDRPADRFLVTRKSKVRLAHEGPKSGPTTPVTSSQPEALLMPSSDAEGSGSPIVGRPRMHSPGSPASTETESSFAVRPSKSASAGKRLRSVEAEEDSGRGRAGAPGRGGRAPALLSPAQQQEEGGFSEWPSRPWRRTSQPDFSSAVGSGAGVSLPAPRPSPALYALAEIGCAEVGEGKGRGEEEGEYVDLVPPHLDEDGESEPESWPTSLLAPRASPAPRGAACSPPASPLLSSPLLAPLLGAGRPTGFVATFRLNPGTSFRKASWGMLDASPPKS